MAAREYNAQTEREANVIGKQLALARNRLKLSQPALCRLLEDYGVKVRPPAVSRWETGENIPHGYQLLALCHALGIGSVLDTFCSEPILNQEGLERLENYRTDLIAAGRYRPLKEVAEELRYIDMPVSLLAVSAGTGNFLDGDCFETVSFPAASVPDGAELGIRVSGDSMEPVYHDGQIVWMQRCERLRPGEVGIFFYDGAGYLKAYSEQVPDPANHESQFRHPVLLSYNRKYAPIPVRSGIAFQIVGRVLN